MPRQYWQEVLAWQTADATAVANTTTETVMTPAYVYINATLWGTR